jgi:hypothetical protein
MSIGKLFQSFVAATENERSPRIFLVLEVVGCNNRPEYERKLYLHCFLIATKLQIYFGASSWIALNVIIIILKSILNSIGSQCKEYRTGVIWQYLGV